MKKADLIRLLAATAEVCGTQFSEAAATIFVRDLEGFDPEHVAGALKRCRLEVKGRLTVSDVINRMDDGRPGPEEAWPMVGEPPKRGDPFVKEHMTWNMTGFIAKRRSYHDERGERCEVITPEQYWRERVK